MLDAKTSTFHSLHTSLEVCILNTGHYVRIMDSGLETEIWEWKHPRVFLIRVFQSSFDQLTRKLEFESTPTAMSCRPICKCPVRQCHSLDRCIEWLRSRRRLRMDRRSPSPHSLTLPWSRTQRWTRAWRAAIHQGRWLIETPDDNDYHDWKQRSINIQWRIVCSGEERDSQAKGR